MNDNQMCVVLCRDGKRHEWDLMVMTPKVSVGWASSWLAMEQERKLGNNKFEAIVVLEEDYRAGKLCRMNHPRGYKVDLLVSTKEEADEFEAQEARRRASYRRPVQIQSAQVAVQQVTQPVMDIKKAVEDTEAAIEDIEMASGSADEFGI